MKCIYFLSILFKVLYRAFDNFLATNVRLLSDMPVIRVYVCDIWSALFVKIKLDTAKFVKILLLLQFLSFGHLGETC